jgi:ribosomal protein S18 acetylase RimI-like enzyme
MVTINLATVAHSKLLSDLGKECFLQSHGHSAPKEAIDTFIAKNYSKIAFEKELMNPANIYHLLLVDQEIAGYSKIVLNSTNPNIAAQNITKLDRLYLLKKFHHKNLGDTLMNFNIELSKQHQQIGIWLAVWVENIQAINFYNKKGFRVVGSYNFEISETHSNPNHIMYLEYL